MHTNESRVYRLHTQKKYKFTVLLLSTSVINDNTLLNTCIGYFFNVNLFPWIEIVSLLLEKKLKFIQCQLKIFINILFKKKKKKEEDIIVDTNLYYLQEQNSVIYISKKFVQQITVKSAKDYILF